MRGTLVRIYSLSLVRVPIKCPHQCVDCQPDMIIIFATMLRAGRPGSEGDIGEAGPSQTQMQFSLDQHTFKIFS